MNEAVPLGKELAARRRSLGLTQEELAALVGVTAVQLCRWETSRFSPSLRNFYRLQGALRRLELAQRLGGIRAVRRVAMDEPPLVVIAPIKDSEVAMP